MRPAALCLLRSILLEPCGFAKLLRVSFFFRLVSTAAVNVPGWHQHYSRHAAGNFEKVLAEEAFCSLSILFSCRWTFFPLHCFFSTLPLPKVLSCAGTASLYGGSACLGALYLSMPT